MLKTQHQQLPIVVTFEIKDSEETYMKMPDSKCDGCSSLTRGEEEVMYLLRRIIEGFEPHLPFNSSTHF